jgi:hypothetical protein
VTERDWLEATDPHPMLAFLRDAGKLSDRKARLFAVACCHRIWHLLTEEASRELLTAVERWADGETDFMPVAAACDRHERAVYQFPSLWFAVCYCLAWTPEDALKAACEAAAGAGYSATAAFTDDEAAGVLIAVIYRAECHAQAELARDLFGNPFCPRPPLAPSLLTWNNGLIPRLAQAAYDDRQLPQGTLQASRLAVLADALEEAGTADTELLAHLRGPGPHVPGCFAVDAVLGRS